MAEKPRFNPEGLPRLPGFEEEDPDPTEPYIPTKVDPHNEPEEPQKPAIEKEKPKNPNEHLLGISTAAFSSQKYD